MADREEFDERSRQGDAAAMFNLGLLEKQDGNLELARKAYQQVIDSGHPDHAPRAMVNLGVLEHQDGNFELARKAYQRAIDSGHPEAALWFCA